MVSFRIELLLADTNVISISRHLRHSVRRWLSKDCSRHSHQQVFVKKHAEISKRRIADSSCSNQSAAAESAQLDSRLHQRDERCTEGTDRRRMVLHLDRRHSSWRRICFRWAPWKTSKYHRSRLAC